MKRRTVLLDVSSLAGLQASRKRIEAIQETFRNPSAGVLAPLAKRLRVKVLSPLRNALKRQTPKPRSQKHGKIQFVSDKQRRFVMALLNGKPYQRTGRLSAGWDIRITIKKNRLLITIRNSAPYAQYVIGKWGLGTSQRSTRRYMRPMQPFHQETGWQPAYETIQKYVLRTKEEARKSMLQWVNKALT